MEREKNQDFPELIFTIYLLLFLVFLLYDTGVFITIIYSKLVNTFRMILKFTNYLMTTLFGIAVILQYNDTNAIRWMLVYGAAFIISLRFALGKLHWATASALAGVCTVWALFKIPHLSASGFQHMLDEVQMIQTGVEAAREFLGLLIIAGWITILAVSAYRRRNEFRGVYKQ